MPPVGSETPQGMHVVQDASHRVLGNASVVVTTSPLSKPFLLDKESISSSELPLPNAARGLLNRNAIPLGNCHYQIDACNLNSLLSETTRQCREDGSFDMPTEPAVAWPSDLSMFEVFRGMPAGLSAVWLCPSFAPSLPAIQKDLLNLLPKSPVTILCPIG